MSGIFISYRRDDSDVAAGRLADDLAEIYGQDAVFRDVGAIDAGEDFTMALDRALDSCQVLIAVIGSRWATVTDEHGHRRLDEPGDWVSAEIQRALERRIRVIPVLISTTMPRAADIPATLHPLLQRQAIDITDRHWKRDMDALAEALDRIPGIARRMSSPPAPPRPANGWRKPLIAMVAVVVLVAASWIAWSTAGPEIAPGRTATDNTLPTDRANGGARRALDQFDQLFILRRVPQGDQRRAACLRMMGATECQRAEELLADLEYSEPTSGQRGIVQEVIATRTVKESEARELAACDGDFRFVVKDHRLGCANGRSIPYVMATNLGGALESHELLIFHATYSPSLAGVLQYLTTAASSISRNSVHLLLSRAGSVVQLAPFDTTTFHVGLATFQGRPRLNRRSLSIEMVNLGELANAAGNFKTFGSTDIIVPPEDVEEHKDEAGRVTYWQRYPSSQSEVAAAIAKTLVQQYRIGTIIGHSDVDSRRKDPGPAFPIENVRRAAGVS